MKLSRLALLSLFVPSVAAAHISIPSGPVIAKSSNQKITFSINHGCTGATPDLHYDTLSVKIDIPDTGIVKTSVRALPSSLSNAPVVDWTGTGATATANWVKWTRDPAELQDGTSPVYEVTIRVTTTDTPFIDVPFVITQVCRPHGGNADGSQDLTVVWTGPDSNPEPSPVLQITPLHERGWNKITLATAVPSAAFGKYFGDALIVWKGTAAFSKNMAVGALITTTPGVTVLGDLAAGDEIWVKY